MKNEVVVLSDSNSNLQLGSKPAYIFVWCNVWVSASCYALMSPTVSEHVDDGSVGICSVNYLTCTCSLARYLLEDGSVASHSV